MWWTVFVLLLVAGGGFAQLRDVVNARRHLPLRDDIAAFEVRLRSTPASAPRSATPPKSRRRRRDRRPSLDLAPRSFHVRRERTDPAQ